MTIANASTILASDLHAEQDYKLADSLTLRSTPHHLRVMCHVRGVGASTDLVQRSRVFTPQAPYELVALFGREMGLSSGQTLTVSLSVFGGDNALLLDQAISMVITSTGSDTSGAEDHDVITSTRFVLRPGIPYQLAAELSATATLAQAVAVFRLRRGPR